MPKVRSRINDRNYKKRYNGDNDFRNLINQVDIYTQNVKEEFDELQYLIKYVKDTKHKVSKHMDGVKNVFKETKTKKNKSPNEDEGYKSDNSYEASRNYKNYENY